MATLCALSDEEIKRQKEIQDLRYAVLTDLLSGEAGNTLFSIVYSKYKQLKGSFFNTNNYDIPSDYKIDQILYLEDEPLTFNDCWLSKEQLLSHQIDYIEEFAKVYINCKSEDYSYHRPIRALDFINDRIWSELGYYKKELIGNVNAHLKSIIKQPNLTIRQYLFEVCRFINNNKFSFTSLSDTVNIPYLDNPRLSHVATISYYSCHTVESPYRKLQQFRECTASSIKCFYQNYMDVKCPFEDEIVGIWYDKTTQYFNRRLWLHSLFLITKNGYYFPVNAILNNTEPSYSDNQESESYNIFLSGALRMAFCYAGGSRECVIDTLSYLHKLLKDSKITVLKDRHSKYQFLYSLPYYSWI